MAYEKNIGTSTSREATIRGAIKNRQITKATQTLLGICAGICADGAIHAREVAFLSTWLKENQEITGFWPGSEIYRRVKEILADGTISDEELADLYSTLTRISGNEFSETGAAIPEQAALPIDDDPSIFFRGMTFCLTGRFIFGTRAACERAILGLGGHPVDNITKKLNYLVIGAMIEPQWANTTYGRKIEKAAQYRDSGEEIAIVSERQWTAALADNG